MLIGSAREAAQRQLRRITVVAGVALTLVFSTMPAQAARGHRGRHGYAHSTSCYVNPGVGYGDSGICHANDRVGHDNGSGPRGHRGHKVG